MTMQSTPTRPTSWLKGLTTLKPAPWRWGRSTRAALSVGLPLAIGLLAGNIMIGLWIAMGTLMQATGERDGSYGTAFRSLAISAPIGALGYLAGYLGLLPWPVTVIAMVIIAFLAGILSSYSAAISLGCLQALLLASIAVGIPDIAPFWQPFLLYLVGAAIYAALLGVEALFFHQRPRRNMLAGLFNAMAGLAVSRADGKPAEELRRVVTDRLGTSYAALLQTRYRTPGRNRDHERAAAIVQRSDAVFALILASENPVSLRSAAQRLGRISAAIASSQRMPSSAPGTADDELARNLQALAELLATESRSGPVSTATGPTLPTHAKPGLSTVLDRLTPGRDVLQAALALALCIGIAYAIHGFDSNEHWFWIPLTVGLIMKPDFGSIVARSIQRSAGTLAGVAIGALFLALLPKGLILILVMALLAGILPWAMQRSYALQAIFLTPLILILVDIIQPGTHNIDYALQRLADTLIGAIIVIVFGYLVWPRRQNQETESRFQKVRQSISDYLRSTLPTSSHAGNGPELLQVRALRRTAYQELSDLRVQLQKTLSDPPPAGHDAAAWFPLLDCAERICDDITIYSTQLAQQPNAAEAKAIAHLADKIAAPLDHGSNADVPAWPGPRPHEPVARLIEHLSSELAHMKKLADPGTPSASA